MQPDCPECKRLWDAFAAASLEHVRHDSKLRIATISHDKGQIDALTPPAEAAETRKLELQQAIHHHDSQVHREIALP